MTWSQDAAGPIECTSSYGTLTIGSVLLSTPAWCLPDLSPLWGSPDLRGSNRLIPGRQGRKAYKRILDETKFTLPILVTGYCDSEGRNYAEVGLSYPAGLEANIAFLQNQFGLDDPSAMETDDSTLEAWFTLPSGNVRTSNVQVVGLNGQLLPGALFRGTLDLIDVDALLMVGGESLV